MSTESNINYSQYSFSEALSEVIDGLTRPPPEKISTGLRDLDSVLSGGLPRVGVSAVAGRPSVGHEEFARHVAFSAARQGHGVLYFSLQRPRREIVLRGLAEALDIDTGSLNSPAHKYDALDLLEDRAAEITRLSTLPILIDDTPSLSPAELCNRAAASCRSRFFSGTPARLLIIDSLACLIAGDTVNADRVKPLMIMLNELAKNVGIHILCTASVQKQVEERAYCEPRLFDLWGDGMVERFCDPVLAIHRDSYYRPANSISDSESAQIIVLRNSQSSRGPVAVSALFNSRGFSDLIA